MPSKVARASQRLPSSAWTRHFLAVAPWVAAIRVLSVPAYSIPFPADAAKAFWPEGRKLLTEAVTATLATLEGVFLSAPFGIPVGQRS